MKTATALRSRLTPLTPIAILFTLVSLGWSGWSITDLVQSGAWGLLAAVSADGLWGVVQYLSYKGIGGRFVETIEWITLGVACALLGWHGWTITHAAAFAGALPPIVAKVAWIGDIRLRRDPTALTAEQEAEINKVIRDSEYISRKRAAEIELEAAEEVALIRAQGKVARERDDVTFQVELERIRKREEIQRRTPLALTMPTLDKTPDTRPDTSGHPDSGQDTAHDKPPVISKDTRPDAADALQRIASAASGPADLVRTLSAHGVPQPNLVSEAIRLRPDMNPDSIRRTAKRLGEGPYL